MVTVSPSESKDAITDTRAVLKASCRRLHITHDAIATAAGVTRPMVVNVFAGRATSARVVEIVRRLIARAERRAAIPKRKA